MEKFNFEVESGGMGRGQVGYGSYRTLRSFESLFPFPISVLHLRYGNQIIP